MLSLITNCHLKINAQEHWNSIFLIKSKKFIEMNMNFKQICTHSEYARTIYRNNLKNCKIAK